jgi:hypothetical protein
VKLFNSSGREMRLPQPTRLAADARPLARPNHGAGIFGAVTTAPWAHAEEGGTFFAPETHEIVWWAHVTSGDENGPSWELPFATVVKKGWQQREALRVEKNAAENVAYAAAKAAKVEKDAELAAATAEAAKLLAAAGISEKYDVRVDVSDYGHAKAWGYEAPKSYEIQTRSHLDSVADYTGRKIASDWREKIAEICVKFSKTSQ